MNGDVKIAEASITYFARQSESLRSGDVAPDKINVLYQLQLTSSADMIAGVRARGFGKLFQDPHSQRIAGQHGMALATRFCQRLPQLGGMVAARTRHLDEHLKRFAASGGRNLIILGVGWDMRPFRMRLPEGMRVYELDFPTTLAERSRRLAELGIEDQPGVTRIGIPIDLRNARLPSVLEQYLDPRSPVFVAWEGMSMYFQEDEVRNILCGIAPLLEHPASLLWVDLVDGEAVAYPEAFPDEVQSFFRGMQILGEPFTFGTGAVEEFMAGSGFRCHEVVPSSAFLNGNKDPVYSLYRFCLASRRAAAPAAVASSIQEVRLDSAGPARKAPTSAHTSP
jgi:methyltransferase (TIGR00027 family)